MRYISTRGDASVLSFEDTVLAGLATDGGLYVPEVIPQFSAAEIDVMRGLSYPELAVKIMHPFMAGEISEAELRGLVEAAYKNFRHPDIAPLTRLGEQHYLLELFHGPTLAFKDFALQFLGQLMDFILTKRGETVTIVGATSGDTGSAAIAGCAGSERTEIYILYPEGRVSNVQRRQMTTVDAPNVHCLAVKGTFDDCQHMVKELFADAAFRTQHRLAAVNSINWARILAQVVYYFSAALRLGSPETKLTFSVPTGNFGDIFAGYIAHRMGLPIEKLIIASNKNDILTRCFHTGVYGMEGVVPTLSPSMDIQISSNFERLLFDLTGRDAEAVKAMMNQLKTEKKMVLGEHVLESLHELFDAASVDDEMTKATMRAIHQATGQVIDPHTAVGVACAGIGAKEDVTIVTLATAHPAKFPEAVNTATGQHPELPDHLADLFERKERFEVVENDIEAVKRVIAVSL